jgi:preprotein translocase subunit YajC
MEACGSLRAAVVDRMDDRLELSEVEVAVTVLMMMMRMMMMMMMRRRRRRRSATF